MVDFLVLWLLQSFSSLFHDVPCALGVGVVRQMWSNEAGHPMVSCILQFDQLWLPVMVSICCKRSLLSWRELHLSVDLRISIQNVVQKYYWFREGTVEFSSKILGLTSHQQQSRFTVPDMNSLLLSGPSILILYFILTLRCSVFCLIHSTGKTFPLVFYVGYWTFYFYFYFSLSPLQYFCSFIEFHF